MFPEEDVARPVEFDPGRGWQGVRRGSLEVDSLRSRVVHDGPARHPHSKRQIGLLQEEEIVLIESSKLLQCTPPYHHHRADESLDRLGSEQTSGLARKA